MSNITNAFSSYPMTPCVYHVLKQQDKELSFSDRYLIYRDSIIVLKFKRSGEVFGHDSYSLLDLSRDNSYANLTGYGQKVLPTNEFDRLSFKTLIMTELYFALIRLGSLTDAKFPDKIVSGPFNTNSLMELVKISGFGSLRDVEQYFDTFRKFHPSERMLFDEWILSN